MSKYESKTIQTGYDPTQGDELKVNSVPVVPLSAMTGTISYDVEDPYTVEIGTIPAGAVVIGCIVDVITAFNAGTTNVLTVGTAADDDHYVAAGDVDESAAGGTLVADKSEVVSADTAVYAKYTQSGTAATAGKARVTVLYAVPA